MLNRRFAIYNKLALMTSTLRLGLFNFRNDDVLLLSGSAKGIADLGRKLQIAFQAGQTRIAIHDLALVSENNPARLFAINGSGDLQEKNSFVWKCTETDIHALLSAGTGASELYFDLSKTPPYFYVNFSGHYNDAWWQTYG